MMRHICQNRKKEDWKNFINDLLNGGSYSIREIERKYNITYRSIKRNKQLFHFKNEKNKYYIGRDRKKVYLKSGYKELLKTFNNQNSYYLLKLFYE